jgi:hypothetical protein
MPRTPQGIPNATALPPISLWAPRPDRPRGDHTVYGDGFHYYHDLPAHITSPHRIWMARDDLNGADASSDPALCAPLGIFARSLRRLRVRRPIPHGISRAHYSAVPRSGRCATIGSAPPPPPTPHRAPLSHHPRAAHAVYVDDSHHHRDPSAHVTLPLRAWVVAGRSTAADAASDIALLPPPGMGTLGASAFSPEYVLASNSV